MNSEEITSNRSRTEIIAIMLETAREGALKTKMMHEAFMSYPQLTKYLELLMLNQLLEYKQETGRYYTTKKGKLIFQKYKKLEEMLPLKKVKK